MATTTAIDWAAIATAGGAVLTVAVSAWATVRTIRSNERSISDQLRAEAEQNRKQQLADMMSTALSHFTGKSQNRGVGIAALRLIQENAANLAIKGILTHEELKQYQSSTQTLLYGQLLYLYMYGENQYKAHEAANIWAMSQWLFSDYVGDLAEKQRIALGKAMVKYENEVGNNANEPVVDDILDNMLAWKERLAMPMTS
jgi:hypothetical protein